jgi:DNA-binding NarL/FixJ family response regulator
VGRVRILVSIAQPLLRAIVQTALAHEPDLGTVDAVSSHERLEDRLQREEADIVIVDVRDRDPAEVGLGLLALRPALRVLTIAGDGQRAQLYQLRPCERPLGEIPPEGLRAAIRSLIRPETA